MSKIIKEYTILISCPSDVQNEKEIIKKVINKFNKNQGKYYNVIFKCVEWKFGTYSKVGVSSPQSHINQNLVDESDMVVAVFWNRAGMPTKNSISGTLEEIERANSQNKQVFLYFSLIEARLDKLDLEQLGEVRNIKKKYQKHSLYKEYESLYDFEEVFENDITEYVTKNIKPLNEELIGGIFSPVPVDCQTIQSKMDQAQKSIFISGASLTSMDSTTLTKYSYIKSIRLLMTKEESKLVKECAKLSYADEEELMVHIQKSKLHFKKMKVLSNTEIRCLDAVMPCSLIGIDIDEPTGKIYIRQYLYQEDPALCPHYVCYYGDPWYDIFKQQINNLWCDSEEIVFKM